MQCTDPILEQSLRVLRAHWHPEWGDRNLIDVFNRLLAKNVRPNGTKFAHLDITLDRIRSRKERWSVEQLDALERKNRSDASGVDRDIPVIVVEYEGIRLVDGAHRINRWRDRGETGVHDVNIHTVDGTGKFVELPALDF
jgi:hypothetical protein